MHTTLRYKEFVRGKILYYLTLLFPNPASLPLLQGELDLIGYPVPLEELQFHLAYLAEKGFVETQLRHAGGLEITLVKVTARGIDYCDGRLPADEGIYVERRRRPATEQER